MALIILILTYVYHVPILLKIAAWIGFLWAVFKLILEFCRATDMSYDYE